MLMPLGVARSLFAVGRLTRSIAILAGGGFCAHLVNGSEGEAGLARVDAAIILHQSHVASELAASIIGTAPGHNLIVELETGLLHLIVIDHGEAIVVVHGRVELVLIDKMIAARRVASEGAVRASLGEAADLDFLGFLLLALAPGLVFGRLLHHLAGARLALLLTGLAAHAEGEVGLAEDPGGIVGPELDELGSEASGVAHVGPGEELLVGEGLEDDATVLAALHVEASPGIRELVHLTVLVRIPIRGVGDVLPDDVGRIGEHVLDMLGGELGLVVVDDDLAPLALAAAVGSLAVPLLSGLLLGGACLFLVTLESTDTNGTSPTIAGAVEAEQEARIASSTRHGRSVVSIEVEATDHVVIVVGHGEVSVGHIVPVLVGEGSEVVGSSDGGSAERRKAVGGHGIFGTSHELDVGDGALAALAPRIVVKDVAVVVVVLFLDEVGVGIEGAPSLVLLFHLGAGTATVGSVVEHPAQVGIEGEVGRGGGGGLGALGPAVLGLRAEHGTAGGIATGRSGGLGILGTPVLVVVLGEDPASGGSALAARTGGVEGEGNEEGPAAGGARHAGDGNAEGREVDELGLVVHVDGLDEQAADGTGGRGLVELSEVGYVEAGPALGLLAAAGGGVEVDEGDVDLVPVLPVGPTTLRPGPEGHLDLDHGLLGVVHEVLDLAGVDPDDAEEEVAGNSEGQGDGGVDDGLDRGGNVGGEDGRTAELLVAPVGRQPHLAQRALLGEDNLRVEHLFEGLARLLGPSRRF
mmetsp:Transcript_25143/g.72712  ORF Transcript_25143/g.72712 Transcript_25143/m.72712 type:complete len:752 (-) Transcript_25143:166-2421(-)